MRRGTYTFLIRKLSLKVYVVTPDQGCGVVIKSGIALISS